MKMYMHLHGVRNEAPEFKIIRLLCELCNHSLGNIKVRKWHVKGII